MSSTFSKPLPFNRLYKLAFILQDYFIFSLDLQYQIQLARGIVEELVIYDCRTWEFLNLNQSKFNRHGNFTIVEELENR
jgi:hypothetical protein